MEVTTNIIIGKIYKLYVEDEKWFYMGCTTVKSIKKRLNQHKQRANLCPDNKMYKILNDIGWDKVKIILLEEYICNTKKELQRKENEYISKNMLDPCLLNIQYSSLDIENISDKNKYQNCDKNKTQNITQTKYLIQQQNYRNNNKEQRKEYDKKHREENIYYIKQRQKIKIQCLCGSYSTKAHYLRHLKSKKHIRFLNNINNTCTPLLETDQPSHTP